jgi:hypothetical protein
MTLFGGCSFGGCMGQGDADLTPEQRIGVLPAQSACHDIRTRSRRHSEVAQAKLELTSDQQAYWKESEVKHTPPPKESYSSGEISAASERILGMCMTKELPTDRSATLFNLECYNKGCNVLKVPPLAEGYSAEERAASVKDCARSYLRRSKLRTETTASTRPVDQAPRSPEIPPRCPAPLNSPLPNYQVKQQAAPVNRPASPAEQENVPVRRYSLTEINKMEDSIMGACSSTGQDFLKTFNHGATELGFAPLGEGFTEMEKEARLRQCAVTILKRREQIETPTECFSDAQVKEATKHILSTCMKKKQETDDFPTLFSRKLFNQMAESLGVAQLEVGFTMEQRSGAIKECSTQHLQQQMRKPPCDIFCV